MDFESWWLIFMPLLFGLGWLAARIDLRHMLSESRNLPDSYFKGLNFLLNEQPDRAIDAFIEVAKLDTETTELHFALGSLFRRRGEMERAIRVHQSLLSRSDLPGKEREHALHEIAQDYLKAGMLDRAEMAYKELQDTSFHEQAMRALVRIYESEHDWPRAIEAVRQLGKLTGEAIAQKVHYHCEMAELELARTPPDLSAAMDSVRSADQAIKHDVSSTPASRARIQMLLAAIARHQGDIAAERASLFEVLEHAPEYASLIAGRLEKNHAQTSESGQLLTRLLAHYQKYPSLDLLDVVFRMLRTLRGAQPAWEFMQQSLAANPSLLALDRALGVEMKHDGGKVAPQAGAASLPPALVHQLVSRHTKRLDRYACRICGFQARQFYWQCPGCHGWETYRPRRLEELS